MKDEFMDIVKMVEADMDYQFSKEEAEAVLQHTFRKCELNGKGDSYASALFESELRDFITREAANVWGWMNMRFMKQMQKGGMRNVQYMSSDSLCAGMSICDSAKVGLFLLEMQGINHAG